MVNKPDIVAGQQLEPVKSQATEKARTGNGEFIRTPEQAERDAEAARLRARSMSYPQIAAALDVSVAAAYRMVQRALADIVREPAADVIQLELDKLEALERAALRVLEAKHITVSNGKVIYVGEGTEPLEDDAPVLNAIDRLVRIQERRAKLLGLDAAQKIDTTAAVRFVVEGVNTDDV